jgi:hypothetical protein
MFPIMNIDEAFPRGKHMGTGAIWFCDASHSTNELSRVSLRPPIMRE